VRPRSGRPNPATSPSFSSSSGSWPPTRGCSAEVEASEERLRRTLFPEGGGRPAAHVLIGEVDGVSAGFAGLLFQLFHLPREAGPLPRGPLREARVPRKGTPAGALLLHLAGHRAESSAAAGWNGRSSTGTGRLSNSTGASAPSP